MKNVDLDHVFYSIFALSIKSKNLNRNRSSQLKAAIFRVNASYNICFWRILLTHVKDMKIINCLAVLFYNINSVLQCDSCMIWWFDWNFELDECSEETSTCYFSLNKTLIFINNKQSHYWSMCHKLCTNYDFNLAFDQRGTLKAKG